MKKYKILKGFIVEKLEGGKTVIFDQERSRLLTFNQTSSFIFNQLKLGLDEDKIVAELFKKYKVARRRLKKDVSCFITELIKKKIISVASRSIK